MFTSVDCLPYTVFGFKKKVLKHINPQLGRILRYFSEFVGNVISRNKNSNQLDNLTSVAGLLLNPENDFTKQEIEEELILNTVAVSLSNFFRENLNFYK